MTAASPPPPYYGWLMLLGIVFTAAYWIRLGRRDSRFLLIYLGALCGAFLGGKLGYILVEGWTDLHQPDRWLRLATGKTVLGALLGGYVGVEAAKKGIGWKQVTGDRFAMVAPLGIILGRLGCLLHGCCLGAVCASPTWWTLNDRDGVPRWPAVPVEMFFNALALAGLAVLRRRGLLTGQHFHLYLISYGTFRFVHEFWRATPRAWGVFSGYQLLALAVVGLGAWGYARRRRDRPDLGATLASPN